MSTNNNNSQLLWVYVAGTAIIAIAASICVPLMITEGEEREANRNIAWALIAFLSLCVIFGVVTKYFNTRNAGKSPSFNPYHRFFFAGTGYLTTLMIVLGLAGSLFVYIEHNIFQALALLVTIIWVTIFLRYFMWAVYHYNINYGLTDTDWEKIFDAREKQKMGFPVNPEDLKAPHKNPYRSQTFGLPPGTVRGMIAFTLLFGGLSLLVSSFNSQYLTTEQLTLIRQQFEFFETAFLMMIAFYFGDKSLKTLQKRWIKPGQGAGAGTVQPAPKDSPSPASDLDEDEAELDEEDNDFAAEEGEAPKTPLTSVKKALSESLDREPAEAKTLGFVQIQDNIHGKVLNDEQIKDALDDLKRDTGIEVSLPVLKAIVKVESAGRGHLPDGRPKILFEGHKFWYWLKATNKWTQKLADEHPSIVYEKWTTKYYLGGVKEYKRLDEARKIDDKLAVYSTSWGLFQILGENLEHTIKNRLNPAKAAADDSFYKDYKDFVAKQEESEYYHLLDFMEFIKSKKLRGQPLIEYIREGRPGGGYDWASFAYGYNGAGYKKNQYDTRLQEAYDKYKAEHKDAPAAGGGLLDKLRSGEKPAGTGLIPIIDAGHGGIKDGKYMTPGKRYKFTDGLQIFEGDINRKIGKLLIAKLEEANIPYHDLTVGTLDDVSLGDRVKKANELYAGNKNYYLVSIHSNAVSNTPEGEGTTASGFEVWTSVGQTRSDKLADVAIKNYKRDFPGFKFRQDMGDSDEDKESNFYVLKNTNCPAFLVENLFYDNKAEAQFLLSPEGQARIAQSLFSTIKDIYENVRA